MTDIYETTVITSEAVLKLDYTEVGLLEYAIGALKAFDKAFTDAITLPGAEALTDNEKQEVKDAFAKGAKVGVTGEPEDIFNLIDHIFTAGSDKQSDFSEVDSYFDDFKDHDPNF